MNPACPRCRGTVNTYLEYPTCITCGWEDYSKFQPAHPIPRPHFFRGDVVVLLYTGDSHVLQGQHINVGWEKQGNNTTWEQPKIIISPECPCCGGRMIRMRNNIMKYRCSQEHRVTFYDNEKKELTGWDLG